MTNPAVLPLDVDLLMRTHELAHVGTWIWNVDTDVIQCSPELCRLLGLPPTTGQLSGDQAVAFVHPDDRAIAHDATATAHRDARPFSYDHRIITADGRLRVYHVRGDVLRNADGVVTSLVGAVMDITQRVDQEEALARSEERFRSIFEQSAIGLALAGPDRRFVRVNRRFAEFVGYDSEELRGKSFLEITHPDDVETTVQVIGQAQASGQASVTLERRYVRKDGGIVWGRSTMSPLYRDDGTLAGFTGVVEDITDRKAASEALKHQSEIFQGIMENLPVMISMYDAGGSLIYANHEWERVVGWKVEEVKGRRMAEEMYPDPSERERAARAAIAGEGKWLDLEPVSRDGRRTPTACAFINLSDGTSLRIGQDLSERRQLEQRLLQSQKMESLGQLAGGVAHDFNNLLTVISASATFTMEAVGEKSAPAEDVREIIRACDRAAALTRQLLAFSRRQMLKPETISVNESVQTMAKTLGRLIGEHIHLAIVPAASDPTVEADPHQLEQVLLNLVVNARDAIQETGTITIETGNTTRTTDGIERRFAVIAVTDDGIGIGPEVRLRMFEPFFTTKPVGKGTGLGLSTVLGIVEQSGGSIEVESSVGAGSTFKVLLPVAEVCERTAGGAADTEQLRGHETVLLVEDEAALRAVASRVLTGLGYTVLEARHGGDGARISAVHDGPIDLLITDIVMPEMGGRELARLVRKQRPNTPVLYISGYTDDELLRRGILESGAQLLRKPFTPSELARAVRQLLTRAAVAA